MTSSVLWIEYENEISPHRSLIVCTCTQRCHAVYLCSCASVSLSQVLLFHFSSFPGLSSIPWTELLVQDGSNSSVVPDTGLTEALRGNLQRLILHQIQHHLRSSPAIGFGKKDRQLNQTCCRPEKLAINCTFVHWVLFRMHWKDVLFKNTRS